MEGDHVHGWLAAGVEQGNMQRPLLLFCSVCCCGIGKKEQRLNACSTL